MNHDIPNDLLTAYVNGTLSRAEEAYVDSMLNRHQEWQTALDQVFAENSKSQSDIQKDKRGTASDEKRFAPPKWMTTLMIVGWGILLVAVVIVLMDVTEKMEDYEREQAPLELAPKDTSGSHQRD